MSDTRGRFTHYKENGWEIVKPLTTRRVIDRLTPQRRPGRADLPVGTEVRRRGESAPLGQVWAQSCQQGQVWVADGTHFHACLISQLEPTS